MKEMNVRPAASRINMACKLRFSLYRMTEGLRCSTPQRVSDFGVPIPDRKYITSTAGDLSTCAVSVTYQYE
jgi:hypothetical protein